MRDSHDYLKDGSDITYRNPAIDVIIADYTLRGQLGREETLNHRAMASQILTASNHHQTQFRETLERLQQARRNRRCQTGKPGMRTAPSIESSSIKADGILKSKYLIRERTVNP